MSHREQGRPLDIIELLHDELGIDAGPEDAITGLGIDSLRLAQLARDLENRFGIPIDPELFDVETVADLAEYIRQRSG